MTRFQRFIFRAAEKLAQRHYEGPNPPARLAEMVAAFATMHPHATRAEWVEFAAEHGRECYRSGYVRGYEHAERDPNVLTEQPQPEEIADALDPSWRERAYDFAWSPDVRVDSPDAVVPEDAVDPIEYLMSSGRGRV